MNAAWFFVSHRLQLAKAARAQGYDVQVAAAPDDTVSQIQDAGIEFHPVSFDRRGGAPLREAGTFMELLRLYRRLRPDIAHHVTIKPVLYGGVAARTTNVPVVVHAVSGLGYVFLADGIAGALTRRSVRLAYRLALRHPNQAVIFQNADDLGTFVSHDIVQPDDAVLVRGSGVDTDVFTPSQLPIRADPPVVVLAARMLRHKGVDEFVTAARILKASGVRARFVLVGATDAGNPSAISADRLASWASEGIVEWWGHRDDIASIFQQASIACLPSYREGLPKVLLEAAACGLPIVTTDVPGCRDVVSRENGILVPRGSTNELAAALAQLIANHELRAQMGARGRDMVIREFHLDRVIRDTLAVYAACLARYDRLSNA